MCILRASAPVPSLLVSSHDECSQMRALTYNVSATDTGPAGSRPAHQPVGPGVTPELLTLAMFYSCRMDERIPRRGVVKPANPSCSHLHLLITHEIRRTQRFSFCFLSTDTPSTCHWLFCRYQAEAYDNVRVHLCNALLTSSKPFLSS